MKLTRRQFLQGMIAAGAAPAIVKAENLMKLYVPPEKKIITSSSFTDGLRMVITDSLGQQYSFPVEQRGNGFYHVTVDKTIDARHSQIIGGDKMTIGPSYVHCNTRLRNGDGIMISEIGFKVAKL